MIKKRNLDNNLVRVGLAGIVIFVGLILFKYIPMMLFGKNILFDASAHIAISILALYFVWLFFYHHKKSIFYGFFVTIVLTLIAIQRIISLNHNIFGISLGILVGIFGVVMGEMSKTKDDKGKRKSKTNRKI